jgi:NarL family two-component system sensor histidine kinase YdfH
MGVTLVGTIVVVLLDPPPQLVPLPAKLLFLLLMAIHMGAYWKAGDFSFTVKQWIIYVALRTALGFAICVQIGNSTVWAIIFFSLSAETLRVVNRYDTAERTIFFYSVIPIFVPLLLPNDTSFRDWAGYVGLLMVFTGILTVNYKRQFEANARAEQLIVQLEEANQQISDYAKQVEDLTLAAERQRMARDLHDTLSQGLAGLVLQLEAVKNHMENERFGRALDITSRAMSRARDTLVESRAAIDDLRANDSRTDLAEAIRFRVAQFRQASGIDCDLNVDLPTGWSGLADPAVEQVERIVSEALTNVMRHAQASRVWVTVEETGGQFRISVRDDGRGFEEERAASGGHYGLLGMRERARQIGGRLEIESDAGGGTTLTLHVPLGQKEERARG